ncbi:hypothetical protein [Streptomyces sp. MH60]|uniref:hypothetical protein n=1 Tax=Streptomyces sp. MH60 TaxID=1940758 RepID=UPI000CEE8301|nr:hypothetical protein [Streptomyces sp. MH60]PPS86464.1 hypothetical protein BZZ08_03431 [Streptomyces sp. MH60]
MIIVTGPQDSDESIGFLAEMAGLLGAVPAFNAVLQWATATVLYCLAGWEKCSAAVADVSLAESFGLDIKYLAV